MQTPSFSHIPGSPLPASPWTVWPYVQAVPGRCRRWSLTLLTTATTAVGDPSSVDGHLRSRHVASLVHGDEDVQRVQHSIAGVARDEVEGFRRAIDGVHVRQRQASRDVFTVYVAEIFVADIAFPESVGQAFPD